MEEKQNTVPEGKPKPPTELTQISEDYIVSTYKPEGTKVKIIDPVELKNNIEYREAVTEKLTRYYTAVFVEDCIKEYIKQGNPRDYVTNNKDVRYLIEAAFDLMQKNRKKPGSRALIGLQESGNYAEMITNPNKLTKHYYGGTAAGDEKKWIMDTLTKATKLNPLFIIAIGEGTSQRIVMMHNPLVKIDFSTQEGSKDIQILFHRIFYDGLNPSSTNIEPGSGFRYRLNPAPWRAELRKHRKQQGKKKRKITDLCDELLTKIFLSQKETISIRLWELKSVPLLKKDGKVIENKKRVLGNVEEYLTEFQGIGFIKGYYLNPETCIVEVEPIPRKRRNSGG